MTAEFIFIASGVLFFGSVFILEWRNSRCTSDKAWFHDWVRDNNATETEHPYESNGGRYVATYAKFDCQHCQETRSMRISSTEPHYEMDYD